MNHKQSSIVLCLGLAAAQGAQASDALAVYGLIDLGVSYFSSTAATGGGEQSMLRVDSGIAQSSRLGFRGSEDLHGGTSVFFTLESGIAADTGALGQGGLLFGRQALVGVRNERFGTLSVGRQYDFMSNLGIGYALGTNSAAGSFAWGLHADAANGSVLNNHVYVGDRTNNSIRYQTPTVGGFSGGVMLGMGESADSFAAGRTVSGMASYVDGRFSAGAAFTTIRSATGADSTRIAGLGSSYAFDGFKLWGLATQVEATATDTRARTFEVGATHPLTPQLDLSGAFQVQGRSADTGNARAVIAVLGYKLSRRSDVYLSGVYARDEGYAAYPVFGGGIQSADGVQSALRVGLRHRF